MSHRHHIVLGMIAALIAVMLLATRGASPLVAGAGFALLLCPIVMGVVMWLLMRQSERSSSPTEHPEGGGFNNEMARTGKR